MIPQTNLARWRFFMKDMPSPESFIDWGFYTMIAAALQRRVWVGHEKLRLFPNIYVILVGPPGVGKGLVIKQIVPVLSHFKWDPEKLQVFEQNENDNQHNVHVDPNVIAKVTAGLPQKDIDWAAKAAAGERQLLIPMSAESATFRALTKSLARCIRPCKMKKVINGETMEVSYVHSSLCAAVEELSSLFKKDSEAVCDLLLVTYDCGDYKHETSTQGIDIIKKCCLNLLGGTTPSFMRRAFTTNLIGDGLTSRIFFIYEPKNRFYRLNINTFSEEQIEAHRAILAHIKKLTELCGEVKFTKEADDYMEKWWVEFNLNPNDRNRSSKLASYYSRKGISAKKLAMILHFSDQTTMEVSLEECLAALEILKAAENKMHLAIEGNYRNILSPLSKGIVEYMQLYTSATFSDLLLEFWDEGNRQEIQEAIDFLVETKMAYVRGARYYLSRKVLNQECGRDEEPPNEEPPSEPGDYAAQ